MIAKQRPSQQEHPIGLIMRRGFGRRSPDAVSALAMLPLGGLCRPYPASDTTHGSIRRFTRRRKQAPPLRLFPLPLSKRRKASYSYSTYRTPTSSRSHENAGVSAKPGKHLDSYQARWLEKLTSRSSWYPKEFSLRAHILTLIHSRV